MRLPNLKKYERAPVVAIPADTAEETAAFIAELVAIGEKMPSGKVSGESLADILADYKKPRSVVVNDVNGNRVAVADGVTKIIDDGSEKRIQNFVTKNDLSDAEKRIQKNVTKSILSESDLEVLRKIQENA